MATFRTLADMPSVEGKRVLVRSELNTPIEEGHVADAYRIEKAVPTLRWLSEKGAKVIVTAHLGRNPEDSLEPVFHELVKLFPNVQFVKDVVGEEAKKAVEGLKDGDMLLLENVRSHPGEKKNDPEFSKALASLADYYVDDAFGNTHRTDASMIGVPAVIPGFAGLLVEDEVEKLSKGLNPESPSLFILGGAKFETKEPLLEAILSRYDHIFIGGALANDFLKAKGLPIGVSLVSEDTSKVGEILKSEKILLPHDVVVEGPHGVETKKVEDVGAEDKIVDVGPESVATLNTYIARAKFILWNGPLGLYEGGHKGGTEEVARHVAEAEGFSVVGGGDTDEAIRDLGLEDKIDFISTGGGAMLDFLVDGELPAVEVLKTSA